MFEFDQYLGFLAIMIIVSIGFWLMFFLVGIIPYWIYGSTMEAYQERKERKRREVAEAENA